MLISLLCGHQWVYMYAQHETCLVLLINILLIKIKCKQEIKLDILNQM
jgi:hypothetical protein